MPNEAIVHVIDDDLAVRQSLAFLLASDGLPVRLHESASAFLSDAEERSVGCILTDVRMPGIDGIEFLRLLRKRRFDVPVIVMTGHADVPLAVQAMKEGAADFVEKPFDDAVLLSAIRATLSRDVMRRRAVAHNAQVNARLATLSERERQVLEGLVAGKGNKTIAHDLGISHRTIEIYRAGLMTKLQAKSLSDLVKLALELPSPTP